MTIMPGRLEGVPDAAVGIDLRWLREYSLQLTDAPSWYSLRARLDGELCGSCDLGLPMSCACPPCEPLPSYHVLGKIDPC